MVVVSGMGAVSSVGRGCAALWAALAEGRDGMRPIDAERRFPTAGFSVALGAMVPPPDDAAGPGGLRAGRYAELAAREAWRQARLDEAPVAPARIALVLGTNSGDGLADADPLAHIAEDLGDRLGIAGPRLTLSTACTSSTNAIGLAHDLLLAGAADVVIAGGSDVLTPEMFAGFHAIGVLSAAKCAPFSAPDGTTLGEGAGFLVLEREADARARAAPRLAALLGYGLSSDAFHETSPEPAGKGVARAMLGALADAGVLPDAIAYVNAHGTGTAANDAAEWRALQAVFGARARTLPVSSTKSCIGHAQGAAGVLEAIATLLAIGHGAIPPTMQYRGPRPGSPTDAVSEGVARAADVPYALSSNSAFGGHNAALVLARADVPAPVRTVVRRPVRVAGVAALLEEPRLAEVLPGVDPRGLDPSTRLLVAAAAGALADARLGVRDAGRERAGLMVGAMRVSAESRSRFRGSIAARGLSQVSAAAFARMVLNAPCGATAKLLELKGPASVVSAGPASGLVAIAYAAEWLATRGDAELLLAGAVDERPEPGEGREGIDAAACAALVAGEGAGIRVAGCGLAGPGRFGEAVARALAAAGLTAAQIDVQLDDSGAPGPRAEATASALAFVEAVQRVRRGEARRVLVGSASGRSATCAIVLAAEGS